MMNIKDHINVQNFLYVLYPRHHKILRKELLNYNHTTTMQLSENLKKEDSQLGAESRLLILGEIMQKFYRKSQLH